MSKDTRSTERLSALLAEIFAFAAVSVDTKAILLVLAVTMEQSKFIKLLAPLVPLSPIRETLFAINEIRLKHGVSSRDLIMLSAITQVQHEISSDELQLMISAADSVDDDRQDAGLAPAITLQDITTIRDLQQHTKSHSFNAARNMAAKYILENIMIATRDHKQTVINAYLNCRAIEAPLVAYYAVIHAMANILTVGGLEAKHSLLYSYKIAAHALDQFVTDKDHTTQILHSYQSALNS